MVSETRAGISNAFPLIISPQGKDLKKEKILESCEEDAVWNPSRE